MAHACVVLIDWTAEFESWFDRRQVAHEKNEEEP